MKLVESDSRPVWSNPEVIDAENDKVLECSASQFVRYEVDRSECLYADPCQPVKKTSYSGHKSTRARPQINARK